ncbi:MAG: hypothetical protein ACRD2G_15445 [Terriglobia bacterium]
MIRRQKRLEILAADIAELQHRAARQRIDAAIIDAKRRLARLQPGRPHPLKPYQVESTLRRIGSGESVLSISYSLHCACASIYRALAG